MGKSQSRLYLELADWHCSAQCVQWFSARKGGIGTGIGVEIGKEFSLRAEDGFVVAVSALTLDIVVVLAVIRQHQQEEGGVDETEETKETKETKDKRS